MANKEIVILGGGIAGWAAAGALEGRGNNVSLVTREKEDEYRSVYSTFKNGTGHLKDLFSDGSLNPLTSFSVMTEHLKLDMDGGGYWMVDYPRAVNDLRQKAPSARMETVQAKVPIRVEDARDGAILRIGGESRVVDAVIDCTGSSAVTNKGDNPLVEYVYGGTFRGDLAKNALYILYDDHMGQTSWANPSIHPGYVDVVASGWGWKSYAERFNNEGDLRVNRLVRFMQNKKEANFVTDNPELVFAGTIGSQVPNFMTGRRHVYVAGDAAGMAIPKTGDGFRWAILGGQIVADTVDRGGSQFEAYKELYQHRSLMKDILFQGAAYFRLKGQQKGNLSQSLQPLTEILDKHPDLKDKAENFLVESELSPKLLFYIMKYEQIREVLLGSFLTQLSISMLGFNHIAPHYPFPEISALAAD